MFLAREGFMGVVATFTFEALSHRALCVFSQVEPCASETRPDVFIVGQATAWMVTWNVS